jgi:hypothetical protein
MDLVPPSTWCWKILEVGASYECNLLIYKKSLCVFLPFGFPCKNILCTVYDVMHCEWYYLWLYVYDMLNAIISK